MLHCFVEKVSNVAISRFLVAFFGPFLNFMLLLGIFCNIWVFWALFAVLLQIRFVIIYALFWVKYIWLKPCLCKDKLSFSLFMGRFGHFQAGALKVLTHPPKFPLLNIVSPIDGLIRNEPYKSRPPMLSQFVSRPGRSPWLLYIHICN